LDIEMPRMDGFELATHMRDDDDFKEFNLTSDALRMQAFCLNRTANYKKSLELCEKFLSQYPQNPSAEDVSFLKAEDLFFLNRHAEAIKAYREFIPWEGKRKYTDEARFRIASALCEMRKWDEALSEMKPLLRANVSGDFFEQLHYMAGLCEYNLDAFEDAIRDFKKFASDYPTKQNADTALLKAALAYMKLKNDSAAMELLEKLEHRYTENSAAMCTMSVTLKIVAGSGPWCRGYSARIPPRAGPCRQHPENDPGRCHAEARKTVNEI